MSNFIRTITAVIIIGLLISVGIEVGLADHPDYAQGTFDLVLATFLRLGFIKHDA